MGRILIADNDPAVNGLLRLVLERLGLEVQQAFDGRSAMAMAREAGVRVVVCDLDMPGASGLEVIESLAGLAPAPHVIVVSGYLDRAVRDRLQALPCVADALAKPFDLLAFAARVRDLAAAAGP
ncbi:MAG: response regulator [Planctomycetes bacterium]|nr:response regulator [Planctomycetota bacterium]